MDAQILGIPSCHKDYALIDNVPVEECHHCSLGFTNIDSQDVIGLYAKLSGLELVSDSRSRAVHDQISIQGSELTQKQMINMVEIGLRQQAGIIITRLDAKRASVTYITVFTNGQSQGIKIAFTNDPSIVDTDAHSEQPLVASFTIGSDRDAVSRELDQIHGTVLKDSPELLVAEYGSSKWMMQVKLSFIDGKVTEVNYVLP
jgi:hypothetical protein